jgi:hypothetical protein
MSPIPNNAIEPGSGVAMGDVLKVVTKPFESVFFKDMLEP